MGDHRFNFASGYCMVEILSLRDRSGFKSREQKEKNNRAHARCLHFIATGSFWGSIPPSFSSPLDSAMWVVVDSPQFCCYLKAVSQTLLTRAQHYSAFLPRQQNLWNLLCSYSVLVFAYGSSDLEWV